MQHVAGIELVPCGLQDVFAGEVWRGVNERHDILQLITKTKRAG